MQGRGCNAIVNQHLGPTQNVPSAQFSLLQHLILLKNVYNRVQAYDSENTNDSVIRRSTCKVNTVIRKHNHHDFAIGLFYMITFKPNTQPVTQTETNTFGFRQ